MSKVFFPVTATQSTIKRDDLSKSLKSSASGLSLNKFLLRLTAENTAHVGSMATEAGGDAYRAKLPVISSYTDSNTGATHMYIKKIVRDPTPQEQEHRPGHPGANEQGMVNKTNVNELVEKLHLSKYHQAANANMQAYQVALKLRRREIDELFK